jgi:hypothetical protein
MSKKSHTNNDEPNVLELEVCGKGGVTLKKRFRTETSTTSDSQTCCVIIMSKRLCQATCGERHASAMCRVMSKKSRTKCKRHFRKKQENLCMWNEWGDDGDRLGDHRATGTERGYWGTVTDPTKTDRR